MRINRQEARLRSLLAQHGATWEAPSPMAAWSAYREYGREVFGTSDVGLLFETGIYDFTGERKYYINLVCQFEISDGEGEFDHFEQLHCELTCAPEASLSDKDAILWSFDYESADAFLDAVEALPAFQAAMQQRPLAMEVYYESV